MTPVPYAVRTQRRSSRIVGRFPYTRIAVRKILPATHIMKMLETMSNAMVAMISHKAGIWIGIRITIKAGVSNGMYVRIRMSGESGFCIAGIARTIGNTRKRLT